MAITGLVLFAMIPAMALTMLSLGIGPFSHPKFIHLHQRYLQVPNVVRIVIQILCVLVLLTGFMQMLGVINFSSSSPTITSKGAL